MKCKNKKAIALAETDELKRQLREHRGNAEPQPIHPVLTRENAKSQASLMEFVPASPGSRKRHCSQQLAGTAKDSRLATQPPPHSFADVANGSRPFQGTSSQVQTRVQVHARGGSLGRDSFPNALGNI